LTEQQGSFVDKSDGNDALRHVGIRQLAVRLVVHDNANRRQNVVDREDVIRVAVNATVRPRQF